jgi:hypothetical protein
VGKTVKKPNNGRGRIQVMKISRFIQVIIPHIFAYIFLFLLFYRSVSGWHAHYYSPTVRHIILLCVVVIVFPLASVALEVGRRKAERKKHKDDSKYERELDH